MTQQYKFLIGKEWRGSSSGIQVVNPFNHETIAEICLAGTEDLLEAITLANKAFVKTRTLSAYMRNRICKQIADGIKNRAEEFARTIASESGKPLVYARIEVNRSITTFEIAAEEANRLGGEYLDLDITESSRGKMGITRRFPIGPIAGISPFNFPLNLISHKVAPAMASGNPIILKPASSTPLTALLLGKVITESDAIEGSISIVPCRNSDAAPLVEDPRLKLITFTGSPKVGWDIKRRAGKKKVVLELGGNAAVIVEPDSDLEIAAKKTCVGAFAYSGQVCISVQRAYIHQSCFTRFMDLLKQETENIKPGDPLDANINFGPMIDEDNAMRIQSWVEEAVKNGATLIAGGKRNGNFFQPTILTGVPHGMKVVCQEAFGPIIVVEPYSDFQSVLERVNDSDFGLQAGIFTNQMDKILRGFQQLEVGGVIINDVPTFRVDNMPYGGVKDSGFGREGVRYSIEEMTEIKLLVLNNHKEQG
jgi:glyceraldehyde-3-phosphate dehydrogenase (NADP+)